jgi:hypothetical protein
LIKLDASKMDRELKVDRYRSGARPDVRMKKDKDPGRYGMLRCSWSVDLSVALARSHSYWVLW